MNRLYSRKIILEAVWKPERRLEARTQVRVILEKPEQERMKARPRAGTQGRRRGHRENLQSSKICEPTQRQSPGSCTERGAAPTDQVTQCSKSCLGERMTSSLGGVLSCRVPPAGKVEMNKTLDIQPSTQNEVCTGDRKLWPAQRRVYSITYGEWTESSDVQGEEAPKFPGGWEKGWLGLKKHIHAWKSKHYLLVSDYKV